MKKLALFAAASLSALTAVPAQSAVIYSSIPDLASAVPLTNSWCSACAGNEYQAIDQFTLGSAATITGFNLVALNDYGYVATSPMFFQILDSTHSTVLFSQNVTPVGVGPAFASDNLIVNGTLGAPINLAAGTYWASFYAFNYAVPGFAGGNGSLLQVAPGSPSQITNIPGGNAGYELLGEGGAGVVPEPSTWALLILGFGAVGAAQRRRKVRVAFA